MLTLRITTWLSRVSSTSFASARSTITRSPDQPQGRHHALAHAVHLRLVALGQPAACGKLTCQVRWTRAFASVLSQATPHSRMAIATSTVTPTWISVFRLMSAVFPPPVRPRSAYTGWIGPRLEPSMNCRIIASPVRRVSSAVPSNIIRPW